MKPVLLLASGIAIGVLAGVAVMYVRAQSLAGASAREHAAEAAAQVKQTIAVLRAVRSGPDEKIPGLLEVTLQQQVQAMANYSASRRTHGQVPEVTSASVALARYRADFPKVPPNTSLERTRER